MILTLRTDRPEAEIALCDVDGKIVDEVIWQAHKELSVTILEKISTLIDTNGQTWADISGIVVYEGPGSFTGLRIGITVTNAIAYAQKIAVAGSTGESWIQVGIAKLENAKIGEYVMPEYGGEANITKPRK